MIKEMKRILLLLAFAVAILSSCAKTESSYPMFWTWMEDREGLDLDSLFVQMDEAGIDGLMLYVPDNESYQKAAALAKEHGVTLYAWIWTLNPRGDRQQLIEEHPDWFDVNLEGNSTADFKVYVNSYKFLSAAVPEVREYVEKTVRNVCEIDGIEGICLDYCRIVDRVLPISVGHRYGIYGDGEVDPQYDFGYHPLAVEKFVSEYGYDPRTLEDPSRDALWCGFRQRMITEVANLAAEVAHEYGKKVTASPFTSAGIASFMTAQDFPKWNLDLVFPMAYSDFYSMEPGFVYDVTVQNREMSNPNTVLFTGLGAELGGDLESLLEDMDAAFRGGAQGVSLYTVAGLGTQEQRARFKAYADSLRGVKRAAGGVMPVLDRPDYVPDGGISLDPFTHPRLMAVVEKNIKRVVAGENIYSKAMNGLEPYDDTKFYPALDLGEYTLVRQSDRMLVYQVTDNASGKTVEVFFPIYGGLISGWDVRPVEQ